ncbi:MAG TPA: 4Fe-4S dicluster domain-containing protein [Bacteroidales bacterium]|nr:4Fe-4S dicluster domain-containing protein [Bacteroidales bacterium]
MTSQIIFAFTLLITLSVFAYTTWKYFRLFSITKAAFPIKDLVRRISITIKIAFVQSKMFRKPFSGILHALVFWGFLVILLGSIEMVVDGLWGVERSLKFLGWFYDLVMASGDVFALIILIAILVFLCRRLFTLVKRFEGLEMNKVSHADAKIALGIIFFLMVTLLGLNTSYIAYQEASGNPVYGVYPVSHFLAGLMSGMNLNVIYIHHEVHWWLHILLIFLFANLLPYSKHFHVFMSVPNVFLSRLEPLGKLTHMETVTREVRLMLNPDSFTSLKETQSEPERFGIKDVEDVTWKNYLDSLSCTECGRCTSVCPASITGKKLSPRKIVMDLRARMREKSRGLLKSGKRYTDQKALLRDYISEEELWACTTCNACAKECPININQPSIIVDMRRYLVMEEGSVPGELKSVFSNIENNGAPWQYSREDRLLWAKDLELKSHKVRSF